jgi:hypothetical protein
MKGKATHKKDENVIKRKIPDRLINNLFYLKSSENGFR